MILPLSVQLDRDGRQEHPWLVYGLLALMIGAYAAVSQRGNQAQVLDIWYRFGASRFQFHWWAPLTCTLLHGGIMHLGGNAYYLWIHGGALERLLGWWRVLLIYVVGAFASVLVQLATLSPLHVDEPLIGASGAISAVLGAFLVLLPKARMQCLFFSILSFRPILITIVAWVVLGLWFVGQLGYTLQLFGEVAGIAFWAHAAGFAVGAALGAWLGYADQRAAEQARQAHLAPYRTAWQALSAGDAATARAALAEVEASDAYLPEGGLALLRGALAAQHADDPTGAREWLARAFRQARDYRDDVKALTAYLQWLQVAPASAVPVEVHRAAGTLAISARQPALALFAFRWALFLGTQDRLEQIVRAVQGILLHHLHQPETAAELQAMLPEVAAADEDHAE